MHLRPRYVLLAVFTLFLITTSASATADDYNPILEPKPQGNTEVTWEVIDSPDVPFSFYWSSTEKWIAEIGSLLNFTVTALGEDIDGHMELGNASANSNDTEIAKDLTLGVWGLTTWHPGFFIKIGQDNLDELNSTAYMTAERVSGNYLNGTISSVYETVIASEVSYDCVVFDYVQDPTNFSEPQKTYLAYDTVTGVLVKANTSYSFGVPYVLELELVSIHSPNTYDMTLLWISLAAGGGIIILIAVIVKLQMRR